MAGQERLVYNNQSLARALQILTAFNTEGQVYSLAGLSETLALPKATVLRLCSTLIEYGFLRFDGERKLYSLGLKLFELGSLVFASFSIRKIAVPFLIKLQEKLNKTVSLGALQDGELVYLDKKDNINHAVRFGSHIGTRRPPHYGMLGEILMAHLPDERVTELLQKYPLIALTRKTVTDYDAFSKRLKIIRSRPYFVEEGEAVEGVSGVSAPIRDYTEEVVAAVGVTFLTATEDEKGLRRIIKEIVHAAENISQAMGYNGSKEVWKVAGKVS